jgi:hypothetical protein
MKILGQRNTGTSSIEKNSADIWNTIRKNIALLSRNRMNYADATYTVNSGDISLTALSFTSTTPEKKTIVTLG